MTDFINDSHKEASLSKGEKLQQLILAVLVSVGAKPHVNREYILHLLYYIDFDHHEAYERSISGVRYLKTIDGAEPKGVQEALQELIMSGRLVEVNVPTHARGFQKLLPTQSFLPNAFTEDERVTIKETLEQYSDLNIGELQEKVLSDTPLMMAEVGELIDYEYVFYRSEEEE